MALETRLNNTARWPAGRRGAPETRPTAGTKWLILCVDDEPDALTILRLYLSAHGFEITVASSAS